MDITLTLNMPTTTATTNKPSVSFGDFGKVSLKIKECVVSWSDQDGPNEGKSLMLLLLATTILLHQYLQSKMNDNLLALVANAIIASDNYRLHNPRDMNKKWASIESKAREHLRNCIGAVYELNRITGEAFLKDTASKNAIFLCGPGANRRVKLLPLWDYQQWETNLKEKFFTGRNVNTLLNNLIETPSKANDDFGFKSPFSMAEPSPSPVKPASVKKGAKVPRKKQTFAAKHTAKPSRVTLSPKKMTVKNPYIKKGRSMK